MNEGFKAELRLMTALERSPRSLDELLKLTKSDAELVKSIVSSLIADGKLVEVGDKFILVR